MSKSSQLSALGSQLSADDDGADDRCDAMVGAISRAYEEGFGRGFEKGSEWATAEIARLKSELGSSNRTLQVVRKKTKA